MWRCEIDEQNPNDNAHIQARMSINAFALDNCNPPHHFWDAVTPKEDIDLSKEVMRCTKCGGLMPPLLALWYSLGVNHGDEMGFKQRVIWKRLWRSHMDDLHRG